MITNTVYSLRRVLEAAELREVLAAGSAEEKTEEVGAAVEDPIEVVDGRIIVAVLVVVVGRVVVGELVDSLIDGMTVAGALP